jgi:hypothetical protein
MKAQWVEFFGRDRVHAKRKALEYWYQNRHALHLTLADFFARCRISPDNRTITFHGTAAGDLRHLA